MQKKSWTLIYAYLFTCSPPPTPQRHRQPWPRRSWGWPPSPRGLFHRGATRGGGVGVPKFKSAQPPSLPISPPPMSPSSYFSIPPGLSPAELLDSPVPLHSSSNFFASPTTGAIPAQRFDWKQAADLIASQSQQDDSRAAVGGAFNDFSFHAPTMPAQTTSFPSFKVGNNRNCLLLYHNFKNYEATKQKQVADSGRRAGAAATASRSGDHGWAQRGGELRSAAISVRWLRGGAGAEGAWMGATGRGGARTIGVGADTSGVGVGAAVVVGAEGN
jgi:hypothetical protein